MSFVNKNTCVLFRLTSGRIILIISEVQREDVCRELNRVFDVQKYKIQLLLNQACHRPRKQIPLISILQGPEDSTRSTYLIFVFGLFHRRI